MDERGIVCARKDVLSNGCCNIEQKELGKEGEVSNAIKRERYSCKTCNTQGCCAIYEYCVSCCLHPGKVGFIFVISASFSPCKKIPHNDIILFFQSANKGKEGYPIEFT